MHIKALWAAVRIWLAGCLLAAGLASGAHAAWLKVTTENFNVYGSQSERDITRMALDLQRFHNTLETVLALNSPTTRRLDVYMIPQGQGLRAVIPDIDRNFVALYTMNQTGPAALVTWDQSAQLEVRYRLFHEYAHHFMYQNMPQTMPAWFSEGFAEYLSTAEFSGSSVIIGAPAESHMYVLTSLRWFSLSRLMTYQPVMTSRNDVAMLYAQGWLFTQYLMYDRGRSAQLQQYLANLGQGMPQDEAFQAAFGMTYSAMDQRLSAYFGNGLRVLRVPVPEVREAAATVTRLDASADAMMIPALRIAMAQSSDEAADAARLEATRAAAAAAPAGVFGQQTLARAEQEYGDAAAALRILDQIPNGASDPYNLYIYGLASLRLADEAEGEQQQAMLRQANTAFAQAYRVDSTYFPALFEYALLQEPRSEARLNALVRAHRLAPQMPDLRANAATALMAQGDFEVAAAVLEPLANSPHPSYMSMVGEILLEAARAEQPPPRDVDAQARARLAAVNAEP